MSPAELNGYPVLTSAPSAEHPGARAVLVYRQTDSHEPYIVATWWPELGSSWSWSHYFETLTEAVAAFDQATKKAGR